MEFVAPFRRSPIAQRKDEVRMNNCPSEIATVLKACCIRWAQAHAVRHLATSSGNPAMIHVNEKLGFRRSYEEVRTVVRFT